MFLGIGRTHDIGCIIPLRNYHISPIGCIFTYNLLLQLLLIARNSLRRGRQSRAGHGQNHYKKSK